MLTKIYKNHIFPIFHFFQNFRVLQEVTDAGLGSDRRDPSVCRLTLAAARVQAVRRGGGQATDAGLATVATSITRTI
jgi:hypothetical protein